MVTKAKPKSDKTRWFWDTLDAYLARNQLKQTRQRQVVVEHFLKISAHVDADDLHAAVKQEGLNIGLATIYRTLNLLKDAGLVTQQSFADGRSLFELQRPGTHHDHLICIECGKIVEFENAEIERQQEAIAKAHGFVLTSHRLDLYGQCGDCS